MAVILLLCLASVVLAALWARRRYRGTSLVGPLFWFELTRVARRGREPWLRATYAGLLLAALFWVHANWLVRYGQDPWDFFAGASLSTSQMPRFAEAVFTACVVLQFVALALLTPVYAAGALAEEKEKQTLELLFTTDLTDREIVLGKLLARLSGLGMVLLTGLPVLSLMELWGGIDPGQVVAGFLVSATMVACLGSLCLYLSLRTKGYLQTLSWSYVWTTGLSGGWGCCLLCGPLSGDGDGHFGMMLVAFTQGSIAFLLCLSAIHGLRPTVLRRLAPTPTPATTAAEGPWAASHRQRHARPPVGDHALWWKELQYEPRLTLPSRREALEFVVVMVGIPVVAVLLAITASPNSDRPGALPDRLEVGNMVIRLFGLAVYFLLFEGVALFSAASVSRERERRTLEVLLTTPLARREILLAKLLGGLLGVHPLWWLLVILFGAGIGTFILHVLAALLLAVALVVYAVTFALLGMWFSVRSRTVMRATVCTQLALLVLGTGPALLAYFSQDLLTAFLPGGWAETVERFLVYGLTPLVALHALTFHYGDFLVSGTASSAENVFAALLGLACYAGLAVLLWRRTMARFQPERDPAAKRCRRAAESAQVRTPSE